MDAVQQQLYGSYTLAMLILACALTAYTKLIISPVLNAYA
jgi:hypothetical protein